MHVFLFDIDGTLVNTRGAGRAALTAALAHEFAMDDVSTNLVTSGRTDRGIVDELFFDHGIDHTPENWERLIAAYLMHLPDCLVDRGGHLLPGVTALLEELARRPEAVTLGLLTGNTAKGAEAKLVHFGIWNYFGFGAFGDEHHCRNEVAFNALSIARARLQQEVPAERIVIIGDTPLDVHCARHIGAKAVAVSTGIHPREELAATQPDLLLDNLADISHITALLENV